MFWYLHMIRLNYWYMTGSEINHSFLFHRVLKILTACRMLKISIACCQIEPEIHSFQTMYIIGGVKYVRNGSNGLFCPKDSPQIMFFCWHKSCSSNFGGVWAQHPFSTAWASTSSITPHPVHAPPLLSCGSFKWGSSVNGMTCLTLWKFYMKLHQKVSGKEQ